jgi:hypothetical protein
MTLLVDNVPLCLDEKAVSLVRVTDGGTVSG